MLVSHRRPTEEAYAELQAAYDFYNDHLFASQERLPACLITYQREKRTMGYFSQARFIRRDGIKADEIAMNPDYFAVIPLVEILQTLVHEMVHLWQYHFGVVRRNPRNFRQPSSSPATSASRSMNLPSVWKV
ncbi:TPA: SprT-like domain-containing protein [Pseudomonas aeruginosa]|nr:SprT-like domain-containing protein [Pseudomonas aeruginosa]